MELNLYCDESCHLLHNQNNFMTLGYISCPKNHTRTINEKIRTLKQKHNMSKTTEIKWTKVSTSKMDFYKELLDLFFDDDLLEFRCVVANKSTLDHARFNLNHDDWYYRMYYLLLGKTLKETNKYNIYVDIKDTCSAEKVQSLTVVLNNSYYSFSESMISKIQHIHSHESEILQLADLLIGAIGYFQYGYTSSNSKLSVIEYITKRNNGPLLYTTRLSERKFNIFKWEGR